VEVDIRSPGVQVISVAVCTLMALTSTGRPPTRAQGQLVRPTQPMHVLAPSEPVESVPNLDALRPRTEAEHTRAKALDKATYFPTVSEIIEHGGQGFLVPHDEPAAMAVLPRQPVSDAELKTELCRGDLLIIGKATARRTLLSANETALFTDDTFEVERVLWPTSALGKSIVVTSQGGEVDVSGVRVRYGNLSRFVLNHRYLVLLSSRLRGSYLPAAIPLILDDPAHVVTDAHLSRIAALAGRECPTTGIDIRDYFPDVR
jgi:hypothetical protein